MPDLAPLDGDDPALFPKLTDSQLALLEPIGRIRSIETGEILFRNGDADADPMVLLEGRVDVFAGDGGDGRLSRSNDRAISWTCSAYSRSSARARPAWCANPARCA